MVVFDEAHDLTPRVTSAVTDMLNPGMLRGTVRDLRGLGVAATALDDASEELRESLELAPDGRVIGDLPQRLGDAITQLRVRGPHRPLGREGRRGHDSSAGARKTVPRPTCRRSSTSASG